MKIRPINSFQLRAVVKSEELLRDALTGARLAGCPKLCEAIKHAIASAGGAVRHAKHRQARTRTIYGVLHVTNTDRRAFANVESIAVGDPVQPRFAWMDRQDCGVG